MSSPDLPAPPPPATRPGFTPYQRRLFALLTIATFFEGFDVALAGLLLPVLGAEFGADAGALGRVMAIAGSGMVLAFFAIRAADRLGRRPVLLASIAGFAVLTLATAFSRDLATFTALQLGARFFLVTQLALAYVILSEELPPEVRGRANGWLGGFASVGAAVPYALLSSFEDLGIGWRGLFGLGAIPLLLWPLYARTIREPAVFVARQRERPAPPLRQEVREWLRLVAPGVRLRFAGVAAFWWTVNFWSGTALAFFTLYAFQERGWDAGQLTWLPLGMIPAGITGYAISGFVMDRFGRRVAASAFLIASTAATWIAFGSTATAGIMAGYFAMVGLGGLWTIAATWTAELFSTDLRATASALTNNVIGRTGIVVGPVVAGTLAESLGSIQLAITWLAAVNLICVPIVWWTLPETRGIALDKIDAEG